MNVREAEKLIKQLERQGARVRRTKSGYAIFTDAGSMGFHLTTSDWRANKNIRAQLERIGLDCPRL
jgi:hypothetical protein